MFEPATAWGALYDVYRLMELRGRIRRGRFVLGLSGAQFALPEAYDDLQDLRRDRKRRSPGPGDFLLVPMVDPAVLFGGSAPFPLSPGFEESSPSRVASNYIVFNGGRPVLVHEVGARRATVCGHQEDATLVMALRELVDGLLHRSGIRRYKKVEIETWNGQPATSPPAQELLRRVGFQRDYRAMVRRMDL
jgi:ATP-dependent Lhr-like helicase